MISHQPISDADWMNAQHSLNVGVCVSGCVVSEFDHGLFVKHNVHKGVSVCY